MTDELGEPVVLDTTVLSNVASSSSISDLLAVLATPATVPAVRKELQEGTNHGHEFLAVALEHVGEDIPVIQINSESKGRYSKFRTSLDLGETEALIGAIERRGTLATDDLAARRLATDQDVATIGSIGILVRGITRGILAPEAANNQLATWRDERGYYSPVERVEDALE